MKKFFTISTAALATIGAIATAAVILYKTGHLTVELEEGEGKAEKEPKVAENEVAEAKPKKKFFRGKD